MFAIHQQGGTNNGVHDPGINASFCIQEIFTGT